MMARFPIQGATASLLALLVALLLAGCGDDLPTEPTTKRTLPGTVTLGVGQVVSFDPEGLSVRFVAVETDSRCPIGVTCIWEGEGIVRLLLSANGQTLSTNLTTLAVGSPTTANRVEFAGFVLAVLGLDPYPREGETIPPSSYQVELRADRL